MTKRSDVSLLKTLREYERIYTQLSTRSAPASEYMRLQVADAVREIREELLRRGHAVSPLSTARFERDCG